MPAPLLLNHGRRAALHEIEKAIIASRLGLNPQNDGEIIRITIPPLTEERRKDLVKQVKQEAEKGKVSIRNIRKDIKDILKHLQKEGIAEDEIKVAEEKLQIITDEYIQQVDKALFSKRKRNYGCLMRCFLLCL